MRFVVPIASIASSAASSSPTSRSSISSARARTCASVLNATKVTRSCSPSRWTRSNAAAFACTSASPFIEPEASMTTATWIGCRSSSSGAVASIRSTACVFEASAAGSTGCRMAAAIATSLGSSGRSFRVAQPTSRRRARVFGAFMLRRGWHGAGRRFVNRLSKGRLRNRETWLPRDRSRYLRGRVQLGRTGRRVLVRHGLRGRTALASTRRACRPRAFSADRAATSRR